MAESNDGAYAKVLQVKLLANGTCRHSLEAAAEVETVWSRQGGTGKGRGAPDLQILTRQLTRETVQLQERRGWRASIQPGWDLYPGGPG